MRRLCSWLVGSSSEGQAEAVLGFCVVVMSLLFWAVLWQADVIGYQRDVIRQLWVR